MQSSESAGHLTQREQECLTWAARGKTAWEIAVILRISERTVAKHFGTAMRKLAAATRTHAVAIALIMQLIEL